MERRYSALESPARVALTPKGESKSGRLSPGEGVNSNKAHNMSKPALSPPFQILERGEGGSVAFMGVSRSDSEPFLLLRCIHLDNDGGLSDSTKG